MSQNKPELLYIGHTYHKKTNSINFFLELLSERYKVSMLGINPDDPEYGILREYAGREFEVLVCFQVIPPIAYINKYVKYKFGCLVPMFDGMPDENSTLWKDYRNFNIINFCRRAHELLIAKGLASHYFQFFPAAAAYCEPGGERSVYYWLRRKEISMHVVKRILEGNRVDSIHVHNSPDPGQRVAPISISNVSNITLSTWYPNAGDMKKDIEKASLYIAPRMKEGIGMSFLEAMAMGRCVISPDSPTMNEYIKDGVTGILYDLKNPTVKIDAYDIRMIQRNAHEYIKMGHEKWSNEKCKILRLLTERALVDDALFSKVEWRQEKGKYKTKIFGLTLMKREETSDFMKWYLFGFILIRKCRPVI